MMAMFCAGNSLHLYYFIEKLPFVNAIVPFCLLQHKIFELEHLTEIVSLANG